MEMNGHGDREGNRKQQNASPWRGMQGTGPCVDDGWWGWLDWLVLVQMAPGKGVPNRAATGVRFPGVQPQ